MMDKGAKNTYNVLGGKVCLRLWKTAGSLEMVDDVGGKSKVDGRWTMRCLKEEENWEKKRKDYISAGAEFTVCNFAPGKYRVRS
jgi:hypothetical protein